MAVAIVTAKISGDAKFFSINGVDFALQMDQSPFSTEVELFEYEENSGQWLYTFDAKGRRRIVFKGPPEGGVISQLPMPDGSTKTMTFDDMVSEWGGAKRWFDGHVLPELNARLARRFPEAGTSPEVPAAVVGSFFEQLVAYVKSGLAVEGQRLVAL